MYKFNEYVLNESKKDTFGWEEGKDAIIVPFELYKDEDTSNIMYASALDNNKFYPDNKKELFLKKLVWIAKQFDIPVNWIMGTLYIETGGKFNTDSRRDTGNGAFGIFQIKADTFRGTFGGNNNRVMTTDPIRQLDYYYCYLLRFTKNRVLTDPICMYLVVLGSRYIIEPMDYKFVNSVYEGNDGLFGFFESGKYKGTKIDLYLSMIIKKPIYKQLYQMGEFKGNVQLTEWINKLGVSNRLPKIKGSGSQNLTPLVDKEKEPKEEDFDLFKSATDFFKKIQKLIVGKDTKC
jgi:hypothetical protein